MEIPVLSAKRLQAALQERLSDPSVVKAVCFDFFDTLVGRTVPPEETKKIAASQLADLLSARDGATARVSGEFIYELRRVLELRLCAENRREGYDPEFNLTDLARELLAVLETLLGGHCLPAEKDFLELFVGIELNVERLVQTLDREVAALLRSCHERGLATAVVSDFYIPAEHFRRLLESHGLAPWVDELFISADFAVTKGHSGRLYDMVAERLGCSPKEMVMIGDNAHADGRMASARGFAAYCLEKSDKTGASGSNPEKADGEAERVFAAVFAEHKAGFFSEMGLTLHYFIHHLFLRALRDRHTTLFFCSKEGEFLRRLFMRYQELRFGRQVIASRYLFVSRKATYICSCRSLDEGEDFARLFLHYRDQSLLEFLQSLNFSADESRTLCAELHLDPDTRRQDLRNQPDFRALVASPQFRAGYEDHRRRQRENFRRYLAGFGLDMARDGLALVDVGWKGSIQDNIFLALDGRVRVSGYYIGLLSPSGLEEKNRKQGILFTDVPAHSPFIHVFNNNRSLLEMVLGASHGSADGYFSLEEWRSLPYARPSSFAEDDARGEHSLVTVLDLPEERRLFQERIAPMQERYFQLFEKLTEAMVRHRCAPPEISWFARCHARMLFKPSRGEVDFFAGLYHLENYGVFEFTTFARERRVPLRQRLENFRELWRNPAAILETGVWQPIIFRRLGLSWLQPVDGFKRYRRIFGGES